MKYWALIGKGLFLSFMCKLKTTAMAYLFGGGILLTVLVILFIFLLPLLALISALTSTFQGNDKIIWILLIIFLPFLGSVLYFLIGRNQRTNI